MVDIIRFLKKCTLAGCGGQTGENWCWYPGGPFRGLGADDDLGCGESHGEEEACLRWIASCSPLPVLVDGAHLTVGFPMLWVTEHVQVSPINKHKLACLGIVYGLKVHAERFFYISQLHLERIHSPLWIISWFIKQNSVCNWQVRKINIHVCFHFLFPWFVQRLAAQILGLSLETQEADLDSHSWMSQWNQPQIAINPCENKREFFMLFHHGRGHMCCLPGPAGTSFF